MSKNDCPFHAAANMTPTDWQKVAEDLIKAGPFRSTGPAIVDDGRDPWYKNAKFVRAPICTCDKEGDK